jgi:chromosome segregation ATPase
MALSGVLAIMLVAAIVIAGYLWNVNGKWQAQVESLTATGYSLGDRIAEHQQQIKQLESANGLLSDQLATAKDKVLSLSNEKAQWSDQTAYAQQQVDLLNGQITAAQSVITQLGRCLDGEKQLVTYIGAADQYTPQQIEQFQTSVDSLCEAATVATTNFQKSLTE